MTEALNKPPLPKGKIVVHVGLPKTATTTLQSDVFPFLSVDHVEYLGVFQPRGRIENPELYGVIYNSIFTGDDIESTRNALISALSLGGTLLLSEEMISVGSEWRKKLQRLGRILYGLNYELIVTVREPASAMFSYYCELYEHFESINQGFYDAVINSEEMKIYHYDFLISALSEYFDIKRVFFCGFEDIINGDINKIVFMITGGQVKNFELSKNNSRIKKGDFVEVKTQYRLFEKVDRLFGKAVSSIVFEKLKGVKFLFSLVKKIDINFTKTRRVRIPSDVEFEFVRKYLANGNSELKSISGIDY